MIMVIRFTRFQPCVFNQKRKSKNEKPKEFERNENENKNVEIGSITFR